ncbi:histidinol-phosphate transaminase [Bacillus spongiae]|uniref:Histidinol-phosphate aminotransferase n=1 Tax=Bacillus spongiae TaxID=2683610 RepID=A0ABU8HCV3_9BACI
MKWKAEIENLKAYQPGKSVDEVKNELGLEKIIKLASNENPYGASPAVKKYMQETGFSTEIYPDGYATKLRNKLASFLKVNESQLLFGNGSDEVIRIIARALLSPNVNTVMATPTFPQYKHNAVIEGAEIREVPLMKGAHDLEGMLHQIDEKTAIVWLCSPNNPTGLYINENAITAFLDQVPNDVLVVLDEAYYEYVTASDYYDALELMKKYPNLLVLRTFSKIYGLASFRVGYGMGSTEVIQKIEPLREPFNNNFLGQGAACIALEDQAFIEQCRKDNEEGKLLFETFCKEEDLDWYATQANFVLIDVKVDGDLAFKYLLEKGFIVRSGVTLGFPTCIRITIGTKETNQKVITSLKEFLDKSKRGEI